MGTQKSIVPLERIERSIVLIRGHKVMLDSSLAEMYGVTVKALNQAVKRNLLRFPGDFMFQLTTDEAARLRSQNVTLDSRRGAHRKYRPYAFTEQGVAMLSSVLRSERAILVNIAIMRTFVELRRLLASHADLSRKLDEVERSFARRHARHDRQLTVVFAALRKLMEADEHKPTLGFARDKDDDTGDRR